MRRRLSDRMSRFGLVCLLAAVMLAACEDEQTASLSPVPGALPDLAVSIEVSLKWPADFCVRYQPFIVVVAEVRNAGEGDAEASVIELNGTARENVQGLRAGESTTVVFGGWTNANEVVVDADSAIEESNESNNAAEAWIGIPTLVPPPPCTPTPAPTQTPR